MPVIFQTLLSIRTIGTIIMHPRAIEIINASFAYSVALKYVAITILIPANKNPIK